MTEVKWLEVPELCSVNSKSHPSTDTLKHDLRLCLKSSVPFGGFKQNLSALLCNTLPY